jgi:hypothetical protein
MICRYGSASQPATYLKEDLGADKEREEVASKDRLRKKIGKLAIQASTLA